VNGASSAIASNLALVREQVAAAAAVSGRASSEITLIGVTKTVAAGRIQEAVDAGLLHLGENRVQEAEGKIAGVRASSGALTWHLVGRLQANKARRAIALFSVIHSVDSIDLAHRLDRIAGETEATVSVLVEVNLAGEATKGGVRPDGLGALLESIAALPRLKLTGLMSIPPAPPPGAADTASRPYFRELRELRDRWRSRGYDLPALSMGMTDDFTVAIEEGATHVRVGRAIFGGRPPAQDRPMRRQE
jgi:pyridoxal phosphate enzyme (YggS family)